jgi:spore coat polysaccharide biosynthesis protein SpsF
MPDECREPPGTIMIIAILQARMSSTRLPGKVLQPILGRPMLGHQIDRLRRTERLDAIVLATSDQSDDDPIAEFCAGEGVSVYRGSLSDVLARFHGAMTMAGPATHIVRLTADCPLADWNVIDTCIAFHLDSGADYTSNAIQRTYPKGLDVEVVRAAALDRAFHEAAEPYEREHVTPYLYRHPELFKLAHLKQAADLGELRWTVDYPADLEMVRAVYAALLEKKPDFAQADILTFLQAHPEVAAINASLR